MPRFRSSPSAQSPRPASPGGGVNSSGAGWVKSPRAEKTAWSSMPQTSAPARRRATCPQKPTPHRLAMAPSTKILWAISIMVAMTVDWATVRGAMFGTRAACTARAAYKLLAMAVAQVRPHSGGRPTRLISGASGLAR